MARKKIIEDKQITEIAELIYDNLYKEGKAIVAESPYLYKVVDEDELNKDNNYIYCEPLGCFYGKYTYNEQKSDGTYRSEKEAAKNLKEAFNTKDKHEFINTILKPEVRIGWQELGYELIKYDFNQEVPYRKDEFIFIKTSPKRNPFKNISYEVYNVYFHNQLILEGVTPDLRKDSSKRPFVVDWPNKITINYEDDKSTTLWIKDENLYARYVDGINFPTVQTYYYSTSGEEWLEIDDPKPDWLEEED